MKELNFDKPLRPIAEFAAMDDFPKSALGEFVDIGGYIGVVVEIISNSIKVRSPEGTTQRFNYHTLRKLYGPRIEPAVEMPRQMSRESSMSAESSGGSRTVEAPPTPPEQRE